MRLCKLPVIINSFNFSSFKLRIALMLMCYARLCNNFGLFYRAIERNLCSAYNSYVVYTPFLLYVPAKLRDSLLIRRTLD